VRGLGFALAFALFYYIIAVIVTNWSLRRNDSATAPLFMKGREDRLAIFATIVLSECEIISPNKFDLLIDRIMNAEIKSQ